MKKILAISLILSLCSCANLANVLPHGKFAVGFMGAEVSFDSSNVVNTAAGLIGGAATGASVGAAVQPK